MPITISLREPQNWPEYKRLRLEALQKEPHAFGSSYTEALTKKDEDWQKDCEREKNDIMIIAWDGDTAIGMAGAYWNNMKKAGHIAHVIAVYVTEDYRGKGVSKDIMNRLIKELKKLNRFVKLSLNVTVTQTTAIQLYKGLEFSIAGTLKKEMKVGEEYMDVYVMEMML